MTAVHGPCVIKIGGRAQGDPALADAIAVRVRRGEAVCVVHGGGDEVSALQRRMGLEPKFLGGRRVTSPEDLDVVRMVLSGTANKRLVATFVGAGLRAVGVSGEDAGLFAAQVTDPAMGRVGGRVTVDATLVSHLLAGGFVPVISPLARDADDPAGGGLNVNGDDAAAALAGALGADELVLVADVPGVLDGAVPLARIDPAAAAALRARDVVRGGMVAKLEAAAHALAAGAARVRITDVAGISDGARGTQVVAATPDSVSSSRN